MPYREVTRARKSAGRYSSHARTHARLIAGAITERFGGAPEGGEYLDLRQFQVRLGEKLDEAHERLRAHDDKHAAELQADRNLRRRRDRWTSELRELLQQIKKTLEGNHGALASEEIFKEHPRLPGDPVALHQLAQRAHGTLNDPELELPEVRQQGVTIDLQLLAQGLEEAMNGLGETLVALDESQSQTKRTQSEKDALLAEIEELNLEAVRCLEALYVIAGHRRMADRLRNTSHLRPGTEPEPGSEPDDGAASEEAAAEPPAAAAESAAEEVSI